MSVTLVMGFNTIICPLYHTKSPKRSELGKGTKSKMGSKMASVPFERGLVQTLFQAYNMIYLFKTHV